MTTGARVRSWPWATACRRPSNAPIVDAATRDELAALASASPQALLARPVPSSVLARMARYATLLEWSRLARAAVEASVDIPSRRDLAGQGADLGQRHLYQRRCSGRSSRCRRRRSRRFHRPEACSRRAAIEIRLGPVRPIEPLRPVRPLEPLQPARPIDPDGPIDPFPEPEDRKTRRIHDRTRHRRESRR